MSSGRPPPTRGSVANPIADQAAFAAPPAHAGISRGSKLSKILRTGAPPPTRGSVEAGRGEERRGAAPPAHAGISPRLTWTEWTTFRAPRPRGDQSGNLYYRNINN